MKLQSKIEKLSSFWRLNYQVVDCKGIVQLERTYASSEDRELVELAKLCLEKAGIERLEEIRAEASELTADGKLFNAMLKTLLKKELGNQPSHKVQ